MKKVAKTGAERIRAYRARIIANENAAAARSANNFEGMDYQKVSQQNLDDENKHSLHHEALSRQSTQDEVKDDHSQFLIPTIHQQDSSFLLEIPSNNTMDIQSSTQKATRRIHSKIPKTAA